MGCLGLDVGLRRQADMSEAVGARVVLYVIGIVHVVSAAHVLDDLQAGADRDDLGDVLQVIGHLPHLAAEVHHDAVVVGDHLIFDDLRLVLGEDLLDLGDRRGRLVAGTNEKAQAQLVVRGVAIKREAGGIRAAVLTPVEHVDQRLAGGLVPAFG